MFCTLQKKTADRLLKPYLIWYLKKPRATKMKGFDLIIEPTVFHPKYFFSSTYFFEFIDKLKLQNGKFLELGCGSGILSLLAFRKGAQVTCCDVNEVAVANTNTNFLRNFKNSPENFNCLASDVFSLILVQQFDCIVINPPYFFEAASEKNQLAWNCGKNGEYFCKLFSQLANYCHAKTDVYMVLADNCDIERIQKLAAIDGFYLKKIEEKKIKWEVNFIFKLFPKTS